MMTLKIYCDGVADISTGSHSDLAVTVENPSLYFLNQISAKDIAMYCDCQDELLEEMEDEVIFEYLKKSGIIYNKG